MANGPERKGWRSLIPRWKADRDLTTRLSTEASAGRQPEADRYSPVAGLGSSTSPPSGGPAGREQGRSFASSRDDKGADAPDGPEPIGPGLYIVLIVATAGIVLAVWLVR